MKQAEFSHTKNDILRLTVKEVELENVPDNIMQSYIDSLTSGGSLTLALFYFLMVFMYSIIPGDNTSKYTSGESYYIFGTHNSASFCDIQLSFNDLSNQNKWIAVGYTGKRVSWRDASFLQYNITVDGRYRNSKNKLFTIQDHLHHNISFDNYVPESNSNNLFFTKITDFHSIDISIKFYGPVSKLRSLKFMWITYNSAADKYLTKFWFPLYIPFMYSVFLYFSSHFETSNIINNFLIILTFLALNPIGTCLPSNKYLNYIQPYISIVFINYFRYYTLHSLLQSNLLINVIMIYYFCVFCLSDFYNQNIIDSGSFQMNHKITITMNAVFLLSSFVGCITTMMNDNPSVHDKISVIVGFISASTSMFTAIMIKTDEYQQDHIDCELFYLSSNLVLSIILIFLEHREKISSNIESSQYMVLSKK